MTTATSLSLTPHQLTYSRHIVTAVQHRNLPKRVAVIAIETALAESNLTMYANGNNPDSLKLPHDAVGFDHGSVGLFQQQVGGAPDSTANWGTTKELMDAETSCGKFLGALARTDWASVSNWVAAQNVQHSAYDGNPRPANNNSDVYGGNYEARDDEASRIVNALWHGGGATAGLQQPPATPGPAKFWVDIFQRAPVFASPGADKSTGILYAGRNYVYGRRLGPEVTTPKGHNHWWLKTDPDEGTGAWVSAYYLTHWGDDVAKDNAGNDIPDC